jgi:hypothetical protein
LHSRARKPQKKAKEIQAASTSQIGVVSIMGLRRFGKQEQPVTGKVNRVRL